MNFTPRRDSRCRRLNQIDGEAVPEPYRTLLVHQNDMTPTLENISSARAFTCDVLGRRRKEDAYFREVILRLDGSESAGGIWRDQNQPRPVHAGGARGNPATNAAAWAKFCTSIKFPTPAGPRAYLRLASDELISQVLATAAGAQVLYGRNATRSDDLAADGRCAEIVEILPRTRTQMLATMSTFGSLS